jgi:hypothetical protein
MVLAVPKESGQGERRVAATPETVARLVGMGFEVRIESQAGLAASFADDAYVKAGATVVPDTAALWSAADLLLKVQPPTPDEADLLKPGAMLISFLWPVKNKALIDRMAARQVHAIAMDQIPRITRAQKMDALSSMANIAGYRAIVEAAGFYGRFFTGQMTAAGKVPAAKVLVIGAGVAGLAAIGAARGLGAIVRAFDTRAAVKEQVTAALRALLADPDAPTACFAGNDHVAVRILKCLAALKVKVPAEFSVVGFDNLRLVEHLPVPLTTVDQPKQEMGRRAAELLFERLELGPDTPARREVFSPHLVIRESASLARRFPPAGAAESLAQPAPGAKAKRPQW